VPAPQLVETVLEQADLTVVVPDTILVVAADWKVLPTVQGVHVMSELAVAGAE